MKRIAGIFNWDNVPVNSSVINCMADTMKYRGDDEQCLWIDGQIGLGGTEIRDHSNGREYSRASCVLVEDECAILFDGRLDNSRELLEILKLPKRGDGLPNFDSDIILAAYQKWDRECPKYLIGDFAFAIWDKKKKCLVCVRDRFGVRPFYYYFDRATFIFASNPVAILSSGRVAPKIHEERIADFLVNPLEGVDKTNSCYADIFRLPPAHMLVVQPGGMTLESYWELSPIHHPDLKTEAEYIDAFRSLFSESVRCRLQDVLSPASMLSGGMDSSSLVGMGRKLSEGEGGKPLHAFAFVSNRPGINRETGSIYSLVNQGGFHPHLLSETYLNQHLDEVVHAIEDEKEPFDFLMNLNRLVYLRACDQKFKVVLDGVDGDILLSGSGHLLQLWHEGAFRTILQETLKADGLTAEYGIGRKEFINSFLASVAPLVPGRIRKLRYARQYQARVDHAIAETLINKEFAYHSHLGDRFAHLSSYSPRPLLMSQMEFHRNALNHTFLIIGLERYERVASSFGIEARHPFTDVRLVEFCLGLPWQYKTRNGWTKYILRRAMEPYLPAEVVWRRDKDSLMWEVNRLILKERADYFYQVTCDEQQHLKPYVDTKKLNGFWQDYLTRGDESHAMQLWSGIALAFWLRRHRNMVQTLQQER